MEIKVQLSSDSTEDPNPKRGATIRQSLNQSQAAGNQLLQMSSLFEKLSDVRIFEQQGDGEAFCTPIIIFQSVVMVRIYYMFESEDADL